MCLSNETKKTIANVEIPALLAAPDLRLWLFLFQSWWGELKSSKTPNKKMHIKTEVFLVFNTLFYVFIKLS